MDDMAHPANLESILSLIHGAWSHLGLSPAILYGLRCRLRASLNPQPSTSNPQPQTLNPQPSTLNPQPSTLNPQPSTLNPTVGGERGLRGTAGASARARPAGAAKLFPLPGVAISFAESGCFPGKLFPLPKVVFSTVKLILAPHRCQTATNSKQFIPTFAPVEICT